MTLFATSFPSIKELPSINSCLTQAQTEVAILHIEQISRILLNNQINIGYSCSIPHSYTCTPSNSYLPISLLSIQLHHETYITHLYSTDGYVYIVLTTMYMYIFTTYQLYIPNELIVYPLTLLARIRCHYNGKCIHIQTINDQYIIAIGSSNGVQIYCLQWIEKHIYFSLITTLHRSSPVTCVHISEQYLCSTLLDGRIYISKNEWNSQIESLTSNTVPDTSAVYPSYLSVSLTATYSSSTPPLFEFHSSNSRACSLQMNDSLNELFISSWNGGIEMFQYDHAWNHKHIEWSRIRELGIKIYYIHLYSVQ
jgi:hypothetical protein